MPSRTLLAVASFAMLAAVACGAPAPDPGGEGPSADSEDALVPAHVYAAPPAPGGGSYTPPTTNVVYVATTGSDASGNGSAGSPYRTIGKAVAVVNVKPSGPTWTIVVRGGVYREGGLTITRDDVTIQRYGTDHVSLLGSVPISGFSGSGPWSTTITNVSTGPLEQTCASPSLFGASGRDFGSETAFAVTRAGVPLRRVATGTRPGAGQYAYDPSTNRLTIGDAPSSVELATELVAVRTKAANVKLAGLDIENYATCTVNWSSTVNGTTYYKGAVVFYRDTPSFSGGVVENSTIANNAASGVAMTGAYGVRLSGNAIVNNGWNGAHANDANGLVVVGNEIGWNNVRHWKNTVEAGMKITHVLDGVIVQNVFEHNASNGFWCDQGCGATDPSTAWFAFGRNLLRYNDGKGVFFEISHHAVVASNVAHDNGSAGIASFGSRSIQIWNNTAVDNDTLALSYLGNVSVIDDPRCYAGDTLPGGKICQAGNGVQPLGPGNPDHCAPSSNGPLANTCNAENVVFVNNILSGSGSSRPVWHVADSGGTAYGAARILARDDFQAYWRPSTSAPSSLLEWQASGDPSPNGYGSLAAFRSAVTGRETSSVERVGGTTHPYFVDYAAKNFVQNPQSAEVWGRGATLPPEVLNVVYWPFPVTTQPTARIGAILWAGMPSAPTPPPATCPDTVPIYHVANPSTGDQLFTVSSDEAQKAAASNGYTLDYGVAFHAAASPTAGLVAAYRLYAPSNVAHFWTASDLEKTKAEQEDGYTSDQGVGFYVSSSAGSCFVPVYRLRSPNGHHDFTTSTSQRDHLVANGWIDEGVHFYAEP